ncbi:Signal-regulatory protein beta-1 isoform 3, partial [Ophiophagus hannah]
QNIEVTQLPETISVKAGENLTLKCTLTGANLPGGVRWYKGLDRNQPPIFSDRQGSSNRGIRVIPGSNTDFTINIQNIQPEDAGIYFCVKFRAGVQERELVSGKGTMVSVIVLPKVRLEINPPAESFYPEDAKVELFAKDAQARKGKVGMKTSNPDGTFSLKSNLKMLVTEDMNFSTFLCLVQQDSQSLVYETITLFITQQLER